MTPEEIASRRFASSLRGYDRGEVTRFLTSVAETVGALRARIAELEQQLERARATAATPAPPDRTTDGSDDAFRALGEETTRILVAAEASAREIRERAEELGRAEVERGRREAAEEVAGARREADRILVEADRRRAAVFEDIRELEATRDRFLADLAAAMETVGSAAGLLEHDAPPPVEVSIPDEDPAPAPPAPSVAASGSVAEPEPEPEPELEPEPEPEPVVDHEPEPEDQSEPDTEPEPELEPEAAGPSEPTPEPAAIEARGVDAVAPPHEDAAAEEPVGAPSDDPATLRGRSLEGIRPGMLRRLKRGLQDVQNGVLDAIRQADDAPEVDDLLPATDDLDQLGSIAAMFLTAAYRAGVSDGAALADTTAPDDLGDHGRVPAAADAFRVALTDEIASSLVPSLRAGVEAGEPATSLSERVGEVFRDVKGPVVEGLVEEHLMRTYGHGTVDVWQERGVARKAWVLADEPRCPENRCRTDVSEGPVGLDEEFASGHEVPPAHDACACALAPVDA